MARRKKNLEEIKDEIIEEMQEEISEIEILKAQNAEYLDKLQRNMAEFDNFRKRTIKEKASMYDDGVSDTLFKLLPVLDNFERALSSVENKEDSVYKGVEMIYNQLKETTNSLGLECLDCNGQEFDPNLHFAVLHEESEEYAENTVIQEMQKGYKYKEKIIRPAMVKVAK